MDSGDSAHFITSENDFCSLINLFKVQKQPIIKKYEERVDVRHQLQIQKRTLSANNSNCETFDEKMDDDSEIEFIDVSTDENRMHKESVVNKPTNDELVGPTYLTRNFVKNISHSKKSYVKEGVNERSGGAVGIKKKQPNRSRSKSITPYCARTRSHNRATPTPKSNMNICADNHQKYTEQMQFKIGDPVMLFCNSASTSTIPSKRVSCSSAFSEPNSSTDSVPIQSNFAIKQSNSMEKAHAFVHRLHLEIMSSNEAQSFLEIVCLNTLLEGNKLTEVSIGGKQLTSAPSDPFTFELPKTCLQILDVQSIDAVVEILVGWIDQWMREDGRLGAEMRSFSRITQMLWIMTSAIPLLCVFYMKKTKKVSSVDALRMFNSMEALEKKTGN